MDGGHCVQKDALPSEYEPGSQASTVALVVSGQREPAGHSVHEACAPML